jgi:hypothetical protein
MIKKQCTFNSVKRFSKISQTDFPATCTTVYRFLFKGLQRRDKENEFSIDRKENQGFIFKFR